jgi:hypothetical protein
MPMPRENEHCMNLKRISTQSSPLPRSLLFFSTMRWIPFCPEWADPAPPQLQAGAGQSTRKGASMHSWAPIPESHSCQPATEGHAAPLCSPTTKVYKTGKNRQFTGRFTETAGVRFWLTTGIFFKFVPNSKNLKKIHKNRNRW